MNKSVTPLLLSYRDQRPDKSMAVGNASLGRQAKPAAATEDDGAPDLIEFPRFFKGRRLRILHNIHKNTSLQGRNNGQALQAKQFFCVSLGLRRQGFDGNIHILSQCTDNISNIIGDIRPRQVKPPRRQIRSIGLKENPIQG